MNVQKIAASAEFEVFRALLQPTSQEDLRRLQGRVAVHLDSLEEQSFSFEFLDLDLARRLARGLSDLIDGASGLDAEGRSLLRGAVEYFLLSSDAEDDVTSPIGLEDDARVFNAVCRALSRADLEVSLPG